MKSYVEELFSLDGRVALVTGGSRGIGEMIAESFVRAGASVYIAARNSTPCQATAERLRSLGRCTALTADVSNMHGVQSLRDDVASREDHLDILVNNAGGAWGEPLETFSERGWERDMNLNVKSAFFLTQALLPLLQKKATPNAPSQVINIGSISGFPSNTNVYGGFAYSASKAAVHQLTPVLAKELAGRHIHVNAIAPGYFPSKLSSGLYHDEASERALLDTVLTKSMGTPDDIGALAIAIATNRYMLGNVIPIDGGALIA